MNRRSTRAEQLREAITRAEEQLAHLEVVPDEDTYEDGAMIRLRIRSNGDELTYLLLKLGGHVGGVERDGLWYHTGVVYKGSGNGGWTSNPFRGWDELQSWLVGAGRVVLEWTELGPTSTRWEPTVIIALNDDTQEGNYVGTRGTDGVYHIGDTGITRRPGEVGRPTLREKQQ